MSAIHHVEAHSNDVEEVDVSDAPTPMPAWNKPRAGDQTRRVLKRRHVTVAPKEETGADFVEGSPVCFIVIAHFKCKYASRNILIHRFRHDATARRHASTRTVACD